MLFHHHIVPGVNTRMCVKPVSTDVHVSGSIVRQGAWEFGTVNNLVEIMTTFPGATFLGIKTAFRGIMMI